MRAQDAYEAINETRRLVMRLYGGNLDHPALDDLESAMTKVAQVDEIWLAPLADKAE